MPTARELLEQADALMRRNRKRGKGRFGDVSTLTDVTALQRDGALAPTLILPETDAAAADPIALDAAAPDALAAGASAAELRSEAIAASSADEPISLDTLGDLPLLTDVVTGWRPAPVVEDPGEAFPSSAAEADVAAARLRPPAVLEQEGADPSPQVQERVTEAVAHRSPALDDEFILDIPPVPQAVARGAVEESPLAAMAATSSLPPIGADWNALAEEIRMQVLQRLDLFTDTGLREQLGLRLQPIVDRASRELVETLNHELGALVRGYVAEAIEREIESWRKREEE